MSVGVRASAVAAITLVLTSLAGCGNQSGPKPPLGGAAALPNATPTRASYRPVAKSAPPAPRFHVALTDGTRVNGRTLWEDRPVVLIFFSSWCTTCAARQDAISDLARKYDNRVLFLGVDGEEEPGHLTAYLQRHHVGYPVAVDHSLRVWHSYAVREPPTVVLISRGGRLLRGWPAGLDAKTLDKKLHKLVLPP